MTETTAQAVDVAAAPALSPEAERLAVDVDAALATYDRDLQKLGPRTGPGAWLAEGEHARRAGELESRLHAQLDALWTGAEAQAEARVSAAAELLGALLAGREVLP